jgi:hypothetical protein
MVVLSVFAVAEISGSRATAQPWEYSCSSAIGYVQAAASEAESARRALSDAYSQRKIANGEYEVCRRFDKDCDWQRSAAESAKYSFASAASTFSRALGTLERAASGIRDSCSLSDEGPAGLAIKACRMAKMVRTLESEPKALSFCNAMGLSEQQCRRCMQ